MHYSKKWYKDIRFWVGVIIGVLIVASILVIAGAQLG